MGIVTRLRCDERSSALLQSGPISGRHYLGAVLSWAVILPSRQPSARWKRRAVEVHQHTHYRPSVAFCTATSLASAIRYRLSRASCSTLMYWQISSAATPASRSLNAREYGKGSLRSACSRLLSSPAIETACIRDNHAESVWQY